MPPNNKRQSGKRSSRATIHSASRPSSGMLSDVDIRREFGKGIKIKTSYATDERIFDLNRQLQLNSVDLHFDTTLRRLGSPEFEEPLSVRDMQRNATSETISLKGDDPLIIQPGEVLLGMTLERVWLDREFAAIISGRNSVGRLGVMVHCTAAFIKPGHWSTIPLQLVNLAPYPVKLDPAVPVCQIVFFRLTTAASERYSEQDDAKYVNETSVGYSKYEEEVSWGNGIRSEKTLIGEDGHQIDHKPVRRDSVISACKKGIAVVASALVGEWICSWLSGLSLRDFFGLLVGQVVAAPAIPVIALALSVAWLALNWLEGRKR